MKRMLFAPLLAAFFCVSCVSPSDGSWTIGPIRIGLYADLSAAGARDGNDALKGAMLRAREHNEAAVIGSGMVEIFSSDIKQSATEAVKGYTSLVQEKRVCAVIGSQFANAALAVSPVAELSKVPHVSLAIDDRVTNPEFSPSEPDKRGPLRRYTFMSQQTAWQSAAGIAAYAAERINVSRYAIFFNAGSPVSESSALSFAAVMKKRGKVIAASLDIPQSDEEYDSRLSNIRDARVEAVFLCGTAEQNAMAVLRMKEMKLGCVMISCHSWDIPPERQGGESAEGMWISAPVSPDDPAIADFSAKYLAAYGEKPRLASIVGWDAVGLVIAAVEKSRSTEPQKVRDALENLAQIKTLEGIFSFDRKTHAPAAMQIAVLRVSQGGWKTVEVKYPEKPAK